MDRLLTGRRIVNSENSGLQRILIDKYFHKKIWPAAQFFLYIFGLNRAGMHLI